MKKYLIIILLLNYSNGFSQNLIPNPGFEQYSICPINLDELANCNYWSPFSETPDYYNTCSIFPEITPPNCNAGFQYPHSGYAYAGFYTFVKGVPNNRELIGTSLLSSLIIGEKYFISFYINLAGGFTFGHTIASNNMGIKFSTVSFSYSSPAPINNTAHFYNNNIITDTVKWTRISCSFIADSAYTFIMIGNFFDDANTDTLNLSTYNQYSYYYIDDVCVSSDSLYCENWLGIKEQSINKEVITIYPNPCINQLNVRFNNIPNENTTSSIVDITGKIIMQTKTTESEIVFNTEKLAKGLYLVKVVNGGSVVLTKFTKE